MIEPISARRRNPVRFRNQVEDLQRTAREKVQALGGEGKYTLPGGDDLEVRGKTDGTMALDVKRGGDDTARLEYSQKDKNEARLNSLHESEPERAREGPQYLDLDRGELMDLRM